MSNRTSQNRKSASSNSRQNNGVRGPHWKGSTGTGTTEPGTSATDVDQSTAQPNGETEMAADMATEMFADLEKAAATEQQSAGGKKTKAQVNEAIALRGVNVKKTYYKGKTKIPVLSGATISIQEGEFVSIIGQSGSGKSTLLHVLGTLDSPDAGEVHLMGKRIDNLSANRRDVIRNRQFGMIFQFYHLLPELTTLENVLSPMMIAQGLMKYRLCRRGNLEKARAILEQVGLAHRLKHKPRELSGGEMQRAAIARALVTNPQVLLADEPTGNLDRRTGEEIMSLLVSLNESQRLSIVMVTHDVVIAERAHRALRLTDGKLKAA